MYNQHAKWLEKCNELPWRAPISSLNLLITALVWRQALLREHLPDAKVRFVNVADLAKLVPNTEHPHGLTDREFEAIFTPDKPVVFNFHSYPWLIHREETNPSRTN